MLFTKRLLPLIAILAATAFSVSAQAGDLDGTFVTGAISTSSASDTVSSASSSEAGKTITVGVGYAIPVADGAVSLGVVGEAVISFGGSSTRSIGASFQPGYYLSDDVVVYGKIGVVSESRSGDSLSGTTVGIGLKYLIAPNTFIGGEIEQIKFTAPTNSTTGTTYNLKDTRISGKLGYVF